MTEIKKYIQKFCIQIIKYIHHKKKDIDIQKDK